MPTSPVGGGFWNPGPHLLEPATFGSQSLLVQIILILEATALVNMGGCISVSNKTELIAAFKDLIVPTIEAKRSYL
jgi:3-deoxy-D-manno-octulosonic-acid transferase